MAPSTRSAGLDEDGAGAEAAMGDDHPEPLPTPAVLAESMPAGEEGEVWSGRPLELRGHGGARVLNCWSAALEARLAGRAALSPARCVERAYSPSGRARAPRACAM
jgi:hypothetical protein